MHAKCYKTNIKAKISAAFDETTNVHTLELSLVQEEGVFDDTLEKLNAIRSFHIEYPDKIPKCLTAEKVTQYLEEAFAIMKFKVKVRPNRLHESPDIQLYLDTEIPFAELRAMISLLHVPLISNCDQSETRRKYSLEFVKTQEGKKIDNTCTMPIAKKKLYSEKTYSTYLLAISEDSTNFERELDPEYVFVNLNQAIHENITDTDAIQKSSLEAWGIAKQAAGYFQSIFFA